MATANGPNGDGDGRNVKASTAYEVASALRAQATRAAQATRDAAARVQEAVRTEDESEVKPAGRRASGEPTGAEAAMAATSTYETARRDRSQHYGDAGPTGAAAAAAAPAAPAAPAHAPAVTPSRRRAAGAPTEETQASLDARPAVPRQQPKPVPHTATPPPVRRGRVRKARLRLLRVDPWSVMKTSFLLSVALGIAVFVAVAVLWSVLDAAGVFSAVGGLVQDLTESEAAGSGVDIQSYTSLSRVLGFTTLIAVVDVVLVTALATLGAFLYNLSAGLLGGLEVTLAEDD
ncbi:MAG TPA: DUF3566 domain-containing protein [Jiangellaceae bacterium]